MLSLGVPVHVIGLDSAWLCGDDNDSGKILLTQGQIDTLTRAGNGSPLRPGFRLALVHHPLAALADGRSSQRLLADTVDLLLHGHQHDPITETHQDPDHILRVIAAGSLFEGDHGDKWINEFHIIDAQLNDEGQPLKYDLEFWDCGPARHRRRSLSLE